VLYIVNFLELFTAVVALLTFWKYRSSNERYFLIFLWYTFLVEVIGALMGDVFYIDNSSVYNTFTITSMLFYFYWYHSILKKAVFKRVTIAFTIIFLLVAALNFVFENWNTYHKYSFFCGAFFILILTIFHFQQLLNSNEVLIVKYKLSFWISTALLLFYMGMIPLFFLIEYTGIRGLSYRIILISLNLMLYGCYNIGFLWTKKEYNRF